jgi:hypothetical protein
MDTTTLLDAIEKLTPDDIRHRLADLSAQERALRTLLRAALARQRQVEQRRQGNKKMDMPTAMNHVRLGIA